MVWWDAVVLIAGVGVTVGLAGCTVTLLRLLPWGSNWDVGGYS